MLSKICKKTAPAEHGKGKPVSPKTHQNLQLLQTHKQFFFPKCGTERFHTVPDTTLRKLNPYYWETASPSALCHVSKDFDLQSTVSQKMKYMHELISSSPLCSQCCSVTIVIAL